MYMSTSLFFLLSYVHRYVFTSYLKLDFFLYFEWFYISSVFFNVNDYLGPLPRGQAQPVYRAGIEASYHACKNWLEFLY